AFREKRGIRCIVLSSGYFNPTLCTEEFAASAVLVIVGLFSHDDSIIVFKGQKFCPLVARRYNFAGASSVHSYGPLGYIKHMCTPVGCISTAGLLIPSPCPPDLLIFNRI